MSFDPEKYRKIRSVLKENRERSRKAKEGYKFFNVDRNDASEYLRIVPKFGKIIRGYFAKLMHAGLPIIYADICGQARATSMGSTFNYSFSIQQPHSFKRPDFQLFKGDIFNKRDVLEFINRIKTNGHKLNYITFEPIVGLQGYDFSLNAENRELHKKVAWQQLENNLTLLLEVLAPGGYMYISKPFQGDTLGDFLKRKKQNEYEISINMKKFARSNKLRIKIESALGGPYFLLHKPDLH